jgi:hypothetical protein
MLVVVLVGAALAWHRLGQRPVTLLATAALATVIIGLITQAVGDMRVSHVIWQTPYGDDSVEAYASGLTGYDSGHTITGIGVLLVLVGGLAFATVLGMSQRVEPRAAVAGAALSIIPPPFILPAFGMTLLLAWLVRPTSRRRKPRTRSTNPPGKMSTTQHRSERGYLDQFRKR